MTTPVPGGSSQTLYVQLATNVRQFRADMRTASTAVGDIDQGAARAGRGLTALKRVGQGVGIAIAAGFVVATKELLAFDKGMRNVQSITKETEAQLGRTSQQVLTLSKVLPQSTTTLAAGLYDIASSGFAGAEGMEILTQAATAASAGLTDTSVSAAAITAVLNAYQRPAQDAADVSDVLFSTVDKGVISFEVLANSLGDYIGTAQALGVSFEETGAAVATMTANGVQQAQVGTAMNAVLSSLIKPSEALTETMSGLGFESGSAMIAQLGLRETMMTLSEATGGSVETMSELFSNVRALKGALALTSGEGAKYASIASKIEESSGRAGSAQAALAEQSKSLTYQFQLMRNQVMAFALERMIEGLPVATAGLRALSTGGAAAADVLSDLAKALGPTWDNLGEVFANVADVFGDLVQAALPVARVLAGLAMGTIVVSLNALTEVLSFLTDLLADNEGAAVVLSIALGVHLAGGVAVLATKLQVGLVMSLYHTLTAMGLVTAGSKVTTAALAGAAGKAGVWAAALYAASVLWDGYNKGANAAAEATEKFQAAMDSGDLQAQVDAVSNFEAEVASLDERLAEIDANQREGYGLSGLVRGIREAAEETGLRRNLDETSVAAQEAELQFQRLKGSVVTYLANTSGLDKRSAEFERKFLDARGAAITFAESLPMLVRAGVQAGDSFDVIGEKIKAYKTTTEIGAGAADDLGGALAGLGSDATDTAEQVSKLEEALNRLVGVFISAEQSKDAMARALLDLRDALGETDAEGNALGATLEGNTRRALDNRDALAGTAKQLLDTMVNMAKAGAGAEELTAFMVSNRDAMIDNAVAGGANREAVEALIETYGLTPEVVATIIETAGVPVAVQDMVRVQSHATVLDRLRPVVRVKADTAEAEAILVKFEQRFAREHTARWTITSSTPDPAGDGPGRQVGGAALKRVLPVLNRLGGRVTSTYRTAAQNARVGGSPTSFHMDRANPAVDIGGPTSVLDRVYARLRAMGGWRELLWRVAGHFDHIHAAATGGAIRGPGTGTSDSIPALLSNGEHVWTAQEVANAGGHAAVESLRSQFRFADGGAVRLAAGGPVNPTAGTTPSALAMSMTADPAAIRRMLQAWQDYYEAADQARRRQELLNEVLAGTDGALQRLREHDVAAYRADEARQVDRLIERLEEERQVRERLLDLQQDALEQARGLQAAVLTRLNAMLDQEAAVRRRQVEASERHQEALASLERRRQETAAAHHQRLLEQERRYTEERGRAMADRQRDLVAWARIDEVASNEWGNTAGQLIENARAQVAQFEAWMAALARARARGLSEEVIGALGLDEGPEALQQLERLNEATAREIADLNATVAQTTRLAHEQTKREAADTSTELGGALLTLQQQHAAALEDLAIQHAEATLAHQDEVRKRTAEFVTEQQGLTEELERIGLDQGRSLGDALAEGMLSSIPAIRAAAEALQAATSAVATRTQATNTAMLDAAAGAGMSPDQYAVAQGGQVLTDRIRAIFDNRGVPIATAYESAEQRLARLVSEVLAGRTLDSIRASVDRLKVGTFDVGGWLQPGYTLAYNGTGAPERVIGPGGGASGYGAPGEQPIEVHTYVVVDGRVIDERVERTMGRRRTDSELAGVMG